MSARWLVQLYPPAWRARYAEEYAALLEALPLTPRALCDALLGALDARLHEDLLTGRVVPMVNRLRGSEITIFLAYMLFLVGYLPFGRVADPTPSFDAAARLNPMLGFFYHAVNIAAEVSFAAMLVGGVPVLLATLGRAVRARQRVVLAPFAAAAALLVAYGIVSGVVAFVVGTRPGIGTRPLRHIDGILLLVWLACSAIGALVGPILIALVVRRGTPGLGVLRFALLPAAVALLTMAAALVGTVAEAIIIVTQAPSLDTSQDTSVPMLIIMVALMAAALGIAAVAFERGARGARGGPAPAGAALAEVA